MKNKYQPPTQFSTSEFISAVQMICSCNPPLNWRENDAKMWYHDNTHKDSSGQSAKK